MSGWFSNMRGYFSLPPSTPKRPHKPKCTYCGGTKFYEGPSGGLSMNILCANDECRHWFNFCPGMTFDDLKKVEPKRD